MQKTRVISLGGSIIVPDEIDSDYILRFKDVIEAEIKNGWKFVVVVGGGKTARRYISSAQKIDITVTDEDRDWLGIHATRLNAHFIRTVFRTSAHPRINTNPHNLDDFYNFKEPMLIAAGWRPGFSTDYDAVMLAKYLDIDCVVNLSNIDCVYDKDPQEFPEAKKLKDVSWDDFRSILGNEEWHPGLNTPFDPVASKLAQQNDIEVVVLNGLHIHNFQAYLRGDNYEGTRIH